MAKLSARGRTEVARVSRERTLCHAHYTERAYDWGKASVYCGLTAGHSGEHAGDGLTTWERTERALMSDGKILEKLDCTFPDSITGSQRHSYGWKVRGNLKPGCDRHGWVAFYTERGWTNGTH